MSFQAMTWAVKQPVDPREKLILIILANYADPKGVCWPSMATLAKDTGYCRRTILRSIHAMQEGRPFVLPEHKEWSAKIIQQVQISHD
jgi:hypothetical protein